MGANAAPAKARRTGPAMPPAALPGRDRWATLRAKAARPPRAGSRTQARRGESAMDFAYSERVEELRSRLLNFFDEHIHPNDRLYHRQLAEAPDRWQPVPIVEELKPKARAAGLWNLFLPHSERGAGLTNLEYAPLAEIMGGVPWSSEVFNCSAPDTGNMETIDRYGTEAQKRRWLDPLLEGEIRSCFAMTEPDVASSDATNIQTRIERDGDHYVINGRKWWSSGAGDPRCAIFIVMGKTAPDSPDKYRQQSMILVPRNTPGLTIKRMLPVFGFDDAPHGHGELLFENVRVPADNILLGEGRGFEIAQGRLGPGRIHHCMRTIGVAEEALEKMVRRLSSRTAFGKKIIEHSIWEQRIAEARTDIEMTRLLCLKAADMMDKVGNKTAQLEIAMIKVAAPNMALKIIDNAIQAYGGGGVSDDAGLAKAYAGIRTLRLADGPDEVHNRAIARLELRKYANASNTH
jgi:acyl-CoA dehydrogenase